MKGVVVDALVVRTFLTFVDLPSTIVGVFAFCASLLIILIPFADQTRVTHSLSLSLYITPLFEIHIQNEVESFGRYRFPPYR